MRQASASDVAELVRLRTEAEEWLATKGVRQWNVGGMPESVIAEQVERGDWFVVDEGDHIGGALRLMSADTEIWGSDAAAARYVHGLVIDRRHSGAGYGRALIGWAEDRARADGCDVLRLDCVESNDILRRFYAGLGFTEVGRYEANKRWNPVVLFEKPLA